MPVAEEKKRGLKGYRTMKLPGGKGYVHLALLKKAGPKGGHSVAGPIHRYK